MVVVSCVVAVCGRCLGWLMKAMGVVVYLN